MMLEALFYTLKTTKLLTDQRGQVQTDQALTLNSVKNIVVSIIMYRPYEEIL